MALKGISVIEIAGLAPVPFAGMVLSDFGAEVIRIDRLGVVHRPDGMGRGKKSIAVNMKDPKGVDVLKRLCSQSDVLIEPFRPGVMERLGLGPSVLMKENPRLVYARLSGFGQTGPYKLMAGHDINYIATSGILYHLCRAGQKPQAPLNLVADFAGGGLTCAFGILASLLEREKSGKGQVVDVSMTQGSAYVSTFVYASNSTLFPREPGKNFLDTGAPFYDTYETKDGRHVAVGAIEPQFFSALIKGLGLDAEKIPHQMDMEKWPELKEIFRNEIAKYTMEQLAEMFDGTDACLTPVLSPQEAAEHPHNRENESFYKSSDGLVIPMPAPKLSRTPGVVHRSPRPDAGQHTREVLLKYGFSETEVENLEADRIVNDDSTRSKL